MSTKAAPGDWMENASIESSGCHVLLGAMTLVVAALFTADPKPIFWTEVGLLLFVLAKEYGYDLREESGETWKSSTVDALGYLVGNLLAWGVVLLAWRLA